jgi:OOP family OmpA-OmpF porin
MKRLIDCIRPRVLLVAALALLGTSAWSQMSYEEFHAKYKPHYETITPDLKAVTVTNESDPSTGALIVELLMQQADEGDNESKLKVIAILTSCKRDVVAKILKELNTDKAVEFMNYAKFEWQHEIMYFVDKTTYHNLAPNLLAMLAYNGPTGPFGPEIGESFAPAYAGAAFDIGWAPFKSYNNVLSTFNGAHEDLTIPKGFGGFIGFRMKDHNFLEIMYQNRGVKTAYENPLFMDHKFNMHTVGINFLKGNFKKEGGLFAFTHGAGLHANFASWKTDSLGTTAKRGSGISGGLSYQGQLFINPFKKVPVMFGLRMYGQLNFPRMDFNGMFDEINGLPEGTTDNDDYASGISNLGAQVQVMYKFGKKKDDKVYTDFNTELEASMDPNINTSYSEILPVVSPDGKTLYFIRADHPKNYAGSMNSQDVWFADISNGMNGAKASKVGYPLNNQRYNMIAGVSPDGNSMMIKGVFDSNGDLLEKGYSMTYRTANGWSKPEKVDLPNYKNMAKGKYVGAYWTQDGKHIIMSMSENADDDNQDLYVSHLEEEGSWTKPMPLGSTINGSTDEHSPFLASDGKTLYFSSNREGTLGNNDIWMTKREDDSWKKWSEPVNLGDEINTEEWDAYYSIDAQGKYAYMASGKNTVGKQDIVRIKLKEEVQPDPVVLITGKVLNQKTNEPLDATISYNGLVDGKNYGVARTNPATGEYKIVLPYGRNYDFTAGAANFIGVSDNLDLTGVGEYQEIERDLYLVPIEVGATVRLNNIFFETGKAELKKESFVELNRVIKFLKDNPTVKIELSGHTDNVGNKDFNKTLSQKRADAVMNYLSKNGIDTGRLVSKGYGMEKPVADNATEEGKAKNRRVEFTILEN